MTGQGGACKVTSFFVLCAAVQVTLSSLGKRDRGDAFSAKCLTKPNACIIKYVILHA